MKATRVGGTYRIGVFLCIELFDFQIQRQPLDFEFGSRPFDPASFPLLLAKAASMISFS
jgi:hypothetical protein